MRQVLATAGTKPVIIVIVSGGIVAIDSLVEPASSIIQAFYPSTMGALALARSIFGLENRWGKLPVTIYASNFINEISMTDYHFSTGVGRTYRYYTGTPLFEFGTGLSYVMFSMTCKASGSTIGATITCTVYNTDSYMSGDEVLMLFHYAPSDLSDTVTHPIPMKQLVGFQRITLSPLQSTQVTFTTTEDMLLLTNWEGNSVLYSGTHYLEVSRGTGSVWNTPVIV
ncbi:family 3 glycoside hydrolase [Pelomyxa schiedti]|nr:family 3 glycoside hydrolase [Pelomyxa schiedti]